MVQTGSVSFVKFQGERLNKIRFLDPANASLLKWRDNQIIQKFESILLNNPLGTNLSVNVCIIIIRVIR